MGKNATLKEKQKWSHEMIHLENAPKLRGFYFIDPEDTEFKETIKNARKKLETSVAPAMPCKIMKNCGSGGSDKNKKKLACILEANESTRMRMGNSEPPNHEDHIAGKGENSLQHSYLVHKFIPNLVPGLSTNSSSGSSSTSMTLARQERHCSTSSSSSSSSPRVSEIQTQEREDRIESDMSPVTVSTMVDERSERPDADQSSKNSHHPKKNHRKNGETRC